MKRTLSLILTLVMIVSTLAFGTVSASAASDTYSVSITTGSYFTIKNLGSGKMLNVYGSKSANNTNITVYQNDNTSGQQFKITSYSGKYYFTPKCASSSAVNVYGSTSKENSNVCVWSLTKNPTQLWVIEYNPSLSGYIIRSASNTNYVLTATGSANSSNVCLKKYSSTNKYQVWTSNAFKVTVNRASSGSGQQTPTTTQKTITKKNYLQVDSKWNTKTYNNSYLKDSGCGIFSIVNAVYNATGNFIDPYIVADWAYGAKYFNQAAKGGGVCNQKIFTEVANKFGSSYGFKYTGHGTNFNNDTLKNHLKNGGTAIVHVQGHYMCLVGYDSSTGKFLVYDPAPGSGTNYNSVKRKGLTSPNGDWKTVSQLSTGAIAITEYWMYAKK